MQQASGGIQEDEKPQAESCNESMSTFYLFFIYLNLFSSTILWLRLTY